MRRKTSLTILILILATQALIILNWNQTQNTRKELEQENQKLQQENQELQDKLWNINQYIMQQEGSNQ